MENTNSLLILPGNPLFDFILNTCPPPGRQADQFYFVVDAQTGFIRNANQQEVDEYVQSGEYDDRLLEIGGLE